MTGYISFDRATKLLNDGRPHEVTVWTRDGEIITYHHAVRIGGDKQRGNTLLLLKKSRERRTVINIFLIEIDNQEVLL